MRQKIIGQQNENELVLSELDQLEEGDEVLRALGAALLPTDPAEARATCKARLDFIKGELDRLDHGLKSLEAKRREQEGLRDKAMQRAQKAQRAAAQEAARQAAKDGAPGAPAGAGVSGAQAKLGAVASQGPTV